ncbi:hypothetical protein DPMN_147596 [Dreissena polymorpha]|uniref:Uncharacterized protein n=1 Tax=Dreissena polymorpha TaxID=45954 RepID=A0A9D4F859_DREPO|nr:hypothetical protein DPMN_147596 [Dreissena polymorpha]
MKLTIGLGFPATFHKQLCDPHIALPTGQVERSVAHAARNVHIGPVLQQDFRNL